MGAEKIKITAIADHLHPRRIGAPRTGGFRHAFRQGDHRGGAATGEIGEPLHQGRERRGQHPHGARQFRPGVANLEKEGNAA